MKLENLPKTCEGKIFGDMVMCGFEPLKNYIQYNNLENDLTDEDIHTLVHAIGQGLENWVQWLKISKDPSRHRHD